MARWELMRDSEYERLRADYDAAFARFGAEARKLRAIEEQRLPDGAIEAAAHGRVEEALAAYRDGRGRLAAYLASPRSGESEGSARAQAASDRQTAVSTGGGRSLQDAVRALAHRLWEQAGHPMGTPDEHWYRAEALMRRTQPQQRQ